MTVGVVEAAAVKAWLSDGREIAFLDVREAGQFGEAHPFFAMPVPYSRIETMLPALVPNRSVRMVLIDNGDGVAARAALRANGLGYTSVHVLAGGVAAWRRAGYTLFAGVNVPSKAFGELVEHARHTPRITAAELARAQAAGEKLVIVDGRPFAEYQRMNIPGGVCCPNGELALRIRDVVPDRETKIVVNCAGRTRSIIGAQTLIDLGIENPVVALENGTQGWFLAGLELERGARRRYPDAGAGPTSHMAAAARRLAAERGAESVSPETVAGWLADPQRTTYLLDVRTAEEVKVQPAPGFRHAPGGQLIQATDQWVGVRGARIVLLDSEEVRAPVVAGWLRELGHEAYVLAGGVTAATSHTWPTPAQPKPEAVPEMTVAQAREAIAAKAVQVIDVRASATYRTGHIPEAVWGIRPRMASTLGGWKGAVLLVAEEPEVAALAALDLKELGAGVVTVLAGGHGAWAAAGAPVSATPDRPSKDESIDYLYFVHDRHDGNAEAARQYIAWEIGLVDQMDAQERGVFKVMNLMARIGDA